MNTFVPKSTPSDSNEGHPTRVELWRTAGPGRPPPLPASAKSMALQHSRSAEKRVEELMHDLSLSSEGKLEALGILLQQIRSEKDTEPHMDEASMWKTLLDLGDVTFLHEPHPGDARLAKSFGLHEMAEPYGWYRVRGGDLTMCHCKEGYFVFDVGYVHAALVAKTPGDVVKWFDDEEAGKTAGNWRCEGEPYNGEAPDQILEEFRYLAGL